MNSDKAARKPSSELEMHRMDCAAIKAAGFASPGALLSAYRSLIERLPFGVNSRMTYMPTTAFNRLRLQHKNLLRQVRSLHPPTVGHAHKDDCPICALIVACENVTA